MIFRLDSFYLSHHRYLNGPPYAHLPCALTMFAVVSSQAHVVHTRPVARVSRRSNRRATRVVTNASDSEGYVLFVTNDNGDFVRAKEGTQPAVVDTTSETVSDEPTTVETSDTSEIAKYRAVDAQKWSDNGLRNPNAVNPAAKSPEILETLGTSSVEKQAIVKQFSMMDRLLGRNPAATNTKTGELIDKGVEKAAIFKQFTIMDRLMGRNPARKNVKDLGASDVEKAAIAKQFGGKK